MRAAWLIANIGFRRLFPEIQRWRSAFALSMLLGGGTLGNGEGRMADKIVKVPAKRVPQVLRVLLRDYDDNKLSDEYFNDYYIRKEENYFYKLLKPLSNLLDVTADELVDLGP